MCIDTGSTEVYTRSLQGALGICQGPGVCQRFAGGLPAVCSGVFVGFFGGFLGFCQRAGVSQGFAWGLLAVVSAVFDGSLVGILGFLTRFQEPVRLSAVCLGFDSGSVSGL